jgi:hypothetical protein
MRKWFLPVVLTLLGSCIVFALVNSYRSRQASEAAKAEVPVLAAQFGYDSSQIIQEREECYDVFRSPCYYVTYYTTNLSEEEFRERVNASIFNVTLNQSNGNRVRGLMMELQYKFRGDNIDEIVNEQRWNLRSSNRRFTISFYNTANGGYRLNESALNSNIVKIMVLIG